ncbi:MAG TPA: serine hydrolase [Chryseosolibacter sp.]
MRFAFLSIGLCFAVTTLVGQPRTDALLDSILRTSMNPLVGKIISNPDTFRLQIIYTQIDRDANNNPSFKNWYFNFDTALYFNPASTVKMPLAFLSLEKLDRFKRSGINKYTPIQFDSSYSGQVKMWYDSTSENHMPSIAHFIKKAFLVSDNDAYNRMYQFLGQGYIADALEKKGYNNSRIIRQFMGFTEEQNRNTNQVRFLSKSGKAIYTQPATRNAGAFDFSKTIKVGRGHLNSRDSLIDKPIDFTRANNVSLEDLQGMLQAVMFPESVPVRSRFSLSKDDYAFLYQYLSQYPSETNYPKYDTAEYYDSYVKFFFRGNHRKMPANVRVFNKVGWAYGFLTDVSYVADFQNKVEYMLAATVYVNSDGILNDNRYEYKEMGWPFLYEVGQLVYQYELQRSRSHEPDLSKFKVRYEQRDPRDKRPSLKDIDN